jgi:V8-like Glu-specific endopeptidase
VRKTSLPATSAACLIVTLAATMVACGSVDLIGQKLQGSRGSSSSDNGAANANGNGSSGDATANSEGAPAMTVADVAHLPACDSTHDGWLMYVMATKSFETCSNGAWQAISIAGAPGATGPTGSAGANGVDGVDAQGMALYEKYRKSVFRVTTVCKPKTPYPATCPANPENPTVFLGSSFLCDDNTACTNIHVLACAPSTCYDFVSLSLQAPEGDTDTLDPGTTQAAPFFTTTTNGIFKLHPTFDVAKIPITGVPAGAVVTPITNTPDNGTIPDLTPTLSMSFPLGFQDMYTDVGTVITPLIGECDAQGGVSGYGCPKALYAFATSNQTDHGSSGSPLFDLTTGQVIGITSAGTDGANADYTWATDAFHITEIK